MKDLKAIFDKATNRALRWVRLAQSPQYSDVYVVGDSLVAVSRARMHVVNRVDSRIEFGEHVTLDSKSPTTINVDDLKATDHDFPVDISSDGSPRVPGNLATDLFGVIPSQQPKEKHDALYPGGSVAINVDAKRLYDALSGFDGCVNLTIHLDKPSGGAIEISGTGDNIRKFAVVMGMSGSNEPIWRPTFYANGEK